MVNRPSRRQLRQQLPDGRAADRVGPVGRELDQRLENEAADTKRRMRDDKAGALPTTSRPQDDVEIEHARAPAAPATPASYGSPPIDRAD